MTYHPEISKPMPTKQSDRFGRSVDYLRISITERCNERCLYCMPDGYKPAPCGDRQLTADEIVRIAATAADLGFRKFRITGGEPLVRADAVEIARRLWEEVPGVQALGLSTNGVLLASRATALKQAGVRAVNISLDALDPALYRRLTGGDISRVLDGIDAAVGVGFERVKLNAVLLRGINEDQILPLVDFAAAHGLPLRFIELMPLTSRDVLDEGNFLPVGEVMRMLRRERGLEPLADDPRIGHGPAVYYRIPGGSAPVGFVGALTNLRFCDNCNKMRLTADGKLRPCLGDHGEIDLRPGLDGRECLAELFRRALFQKPETHAFRGNYQPKRPMTAIGG